MPEPGFPVFDADNHLYESPDLLPTYLPKQYARDIQFVQVRGRPRIAVKGKITDYMPNPTFERVARPGAHVDFYRGTNTEGKSLREMSGDPIDCLPAFREPGPRLELLDELNVHRALVFPTLANLLEYTLDGDPDLTHAAVHAVNEWLYDVWSFDYHNRIFTAPVITLPIVDEAINELEWVLDRGAKVVLVRPAPVTGLRGSRSFALPEFDPIWARLEEAEVPVCLHASFPPLTSYYEKWEPGRSDNAFASTPLKQLILQHREVEDALAALVCQGALTRFPQLKVVSVENGADWVGHLLGQLDLCYRRMPQNFDEHPVEVFRRNVYVNPFWEDDVQSLVDLIGVEHVLFGSDYPHPEGLAEPLDYLDHLAEFPSIDDAATRLIMSENANGLLGLPTAA
jgi:predicted TIM-barrel fold metal-dependent hydrolase